MVQEKIIEYSEMLLEEEIFWTYLPIGKHQISNPDSPRHVTIRKKGFMGQRSKIVQLSGIGYFETLDQSGRHLLRRYLWTYSPDRSSREGVGAGSLQILGNFKMNKVKSQYPCPMVNQFKHLYIGPVVTSILTKNCKKQSPLREWKTYSEARFWC